MNEPIIIQVFGSGFDREAGKSYLYDGVNFGEVKSWHNVVSVTMDASQFRAFKKKVEEK